MQLFIAADVSWIRYNIRCREEEDIIMSGPRNDLIKADLDIALFYLHRELKFSLQEALFYSGKLDKDQLDWKYEVTEKLDRIRDEMKVTDDPKILIAEASASLKKKWMESPIKSEFAQIAGGMHARLGKMIGEEVHEDAKKINLDRYKSLTDLLDQVGNRYGKWVAKNSELHQSQAKESTQEKLPSKSSVASAVAALAPKTEEQKGMLETMGKTKVDADEPPPPPPEEANESAPTVTNENVSIPEVPRNRSSAFSNKK